MKAKPKKGTSLHQFIATGGKPSQYKKVNNVEAKTKDSKKGAK